MDKLIVSVVVPTYNERANVRPLLARLTRALAGIPCEIIFVDDSDDGTEQEIAACDAGMPIHVIHREGSERKGGLSTAVLRGVAVARADYICIMDGDLQHPPEAIPALVDKASESGADIVIASRHVPGGSSGGLEGPWRRFISFAFGVLSRLLFYEKLRKVRDPLSGFLLVRHSALEGVTLRPIGYKISLEILIRAAGSHVEEVPYTFTERESGESKASLSTGFTFLRHAGLLLVEVPEVGRFWKFATVGASGVLVYIGLLWLLTTQFGWHHLIAWAAGAEAAVLSNFTWNRNVTWFERRSVGTSALLVEGFKYHVASALSVAANFAVFLALTTAGFGALVAGAISVWVGVAISYLGAERFVFTTRRAGPLRRNILPTSRDVIGEPEEHSGLVRGVPATPPVGRTDD